MVISASRSWRTVLPNTARNRETGMRSAIADRIAASRHAVPGAESHGHVYTAPYGVGLPTAGGIRWIRLWSPGQGTAMSVESSATLIGLYAQSSTHATSRK